MGRAGARIAALGVSAGQTVHGDAKAQATRDARAATAVAKLRDGSKTPR